MAATRFDAILLGLTARTGRGVFDTVRQQNPTAPIIVISEAYDCELAAVLLKGGAQDFLVKGQVEAHILMRTLLFAVARQRVLQDLQSSLVLDELTGLYNRRGFLTLAQHQLRVSERNQQGLTLFYADMDNLKWINDTFGHRAGDEAIQRMADALRNTLRNSDIISRLGGDEFVILVLDTDVTVAGELISRRQ